MNNLNKITEFLEESDKHVIDIVDGETGAQLEMKASAASIYAKHSNLTDFFKEFTGHDTLQILKLRKHGNAYKRVFPVINANLVSKKPIAKPPPPTPAPTADFSGMNGAFGMNGAQILAAVSKEMDYGRLEAAFEREKSKNLILEQRLQKATTDLAKAELGLNTADRERELDVKAVVSDQKSFVDSEIVKELVKQLPGILSTLKPAAPSVGMGQADPGISEQKNSFINAIRSKEVTDDMLAKMYVTIQGLIQNQEFTAAYTDLLQTFKLLQN